MTSKFCVVGSPIEHTLSPVLHKAAFQYLGLDADYEKHEVQQGELAGFIASNSFAGLSITMPLKNEAFEFAASHDENSQLTKAANTLIARDNSWHAANTDVLGLMKALGGIGEPQKVSLIGSGATSRSALVAIKKLFPGTEIHLHARNQRKLSDLATFARELGFEPITRELVPRDLLSSDLVVSLVPQDSYPELWNDVASIGAAPLGWLFDVSYNPWPSKAATAWGSERTISGIEMLIWQAIEQVGHFVTGLDVNLTLDKDMLYSVMKQAVSSK